MFPVPKHSRASSIQATLSIGDKYYILDDYNVLHELQIGGVTWKRVSSTPLNPISKERIKANGMWNVGGTIYFTGTNGDGDGIIAMLEK